MNPLLGVIYHWLGGLASGSFYVPFRGVKRWSWETSWIVAGVFSWLIAPWFFATLNTTDVLTVLKETPKDIWFNSFICGACWGLGGLTFGLAMRYLGMSLGMAVALGYCTVFGTLIPPIFHHEFKAKLIESANGPWILAGLAVCVIGIVVTALAGKAKEGEMSVEQKRETVKEFDFKKGLLVATFSGIMSAFFAFGLSAGEKIRETTYKVDIVNDAASQGKTVARVEDPKDEDIANFLNRPVVEALFKTDDKPSLAGVIGFIEQPTTLRNKIQGLNKKGNLSSAESMQLEKLEKSVSEAAEKFTATSAALFGSNTDTAKRLANYQRSLQPLAADAELFGIVDELTTLSEKETALNVVDAGADLKVIHARHSLWTGLPVLIVVLLGGFTTNFIWCLLLNLKNRSGYEYFSSQQRLSAQRKDQSAIENITDASAGKLNQLGAANDRRIPLVGNYLFAALAGTLWYFQFFFYSMGETQMGDFKFSSWTLHMASIIIFSSIWGLALKEWKGASAKSKGLLYAGLGILVLSTVIVGYGNYIGAQGGH
jgi:L-rhamnose-proton symport protein (RhaT)